MKMSDLAKYVRARTARDSEFADGLESGYTDFKVGALLRQAREKAGLTQEEVAERFQLSSGTCSSSYFSTSTPMISINDASGCVSSSPTMSIKVSSIWTRRSYSCSVWGTNKSGARVGHTCSTVSMPVGALRFGCRRRLIRPTPHGSAMEPRHFGRPPSRHPGRRQPPPRPRAPARLVRRRTAAQRLHVLEILPLERLRQPLRRLLVARPGAGDEHRAAHEPGLEAIRVAARHQEHGPGALSRRQRDQQTPTGTQRVEPRIQGTGRSGAHVEDVAIRQRPLGS